MHHSEFRTNKGNDSRKCCYAEVFRTANAGPPSEDVKEIDPKDVYVVHGGRFLETEQFAALYGSLDKSNRYPVMGWSRDFSSVGDPEAVLVELLCFVEEEIPGIQIPVLSPQLSE